jgi:hypothetical protein
VDVSAARAFRDLARERCAIRQVVVSPDAQTLRRPVGTHLAAFEGVIDPQRLVLTDLWCQAIDIHDERPLTRPAALAAHAVEHEDQRRRERGIPSIFELPRFSPVAPTAPTAPIAPAGPGSP